MPSPFPGMDPFLENPVLFPGFHDSLIAYLREYLQPRLPDPYFADFGDRLWVEVSRRYIEPDVNVLQARRDPRNGNSSSSTGGGVAVAEATRTKPVVVHVPHDERRETFIDIYARQGGERLVTNIEVLSLTNKTSGEHGRDLYQRKQREVLSARVNLVEIDLLRAGVHTTAVPKGFLSEQVGALDYHVCIHRFDNLEDYFVYPILLADRLPEISIPLLPEHGAISFDLQAVFERCYETGPYRRRVQYAADPIVPPLGNEQGSWATQILHAKGIVRPA